MPSILEYMKFSLNVYLASVENLIGVPLGWTRPDWQPDMPSGFSAGTFIKNNWKSLETIGLALMLGASLTACGAGSIKWKEEVQLSNGKVIVVERELVIESGGDEWANNRSLSKPKEYRIQFADPDGSGKTIMWHSTKRTSDTWPEIPLILDTISRKMTIFSSNSVSGGCLVYNKYLYQNGVWFEEKLPPTFEQRATNLFVFSINKDFKKFIDAKTKIAIMSKHHARDRSNRYDQVGPSHPNCKGL